MQIQKWYFFFLQIVPKGSSAEVSIQKDILKTIETIKTKLSADKRGNCQLKNNYIFLEQQSEPDGSISMDVNQFLDKAGLQIRIYTLFNMV